MKKIVFLLPAVLLVSLAGCGASVSTTNTQGSTPSVPPQTTQPTGTTNTPSQQKFSDQPYASYSYLISGDTLSADAKSALSGFQMQKQHMADGSTQITLKALQPQYHDQQYTLKPGEQLYFIEKFLGDDPNENEEHNLGDDSAVVVDAQGNVVQIPRDFSR